MIDEKNKMDEIVENMANYICDHICQKPKEITDQEIRIHLGNFYDEYQEIVLCKEYEYKASHPVTDLSYCRLGMGMDGTLKETDGCSRGVKVSDSDTSK